MTRRVGRAMTLAVSGLLLSPMGVLALAGPAGAAPGADLAVTISAPGLLAYNDTEHIRFTVTNVGDAPSTPTSLAVSLYPQASGSDDFNCTGPNPTTASCPIPVLAPGATVSFGFSERPRDSDWGGSGTVTGALPPGDAVASNDQASKTTAFAGPTTFAETLTGPGPTITAGSTITLRVTTTNTGQNPGVTSLELNFDPTMAPPSYSAPSSVQCSADPFVWQCGSGVLAVGESVTIDFPFAIPRSDAGKRLTATLASDSRSTWTALVVAPPATPSAPRPPAAPAASPGAAGDPAAPTLANTGPRVGWEAALAAVLCLTGLGLNAGARRLAPARR